MSNGDDNRDIYGVVARDGLFAIKGDLDGHKEEDFQEREQFIGLIVGAEEFLMPIAQVREIIMLTPITFVPNAPAMVDGVINLRGNIIPAINMRKMMGTPRGEMMSRANLVNRSNPVYLRGTHGRHGKSYYRSELKTSLHCS